jgi:hypothetical protein
LVASLIGRNQDAYLETLEGSGRAVQGLADLLTERITPVYRKYAAAEGLREEAFSGLTARTEEEINRAYLEAFQENGRAVQRLVSILSDRILPVYERYAAAAGLAGEAELGLTRTLDGEGGLTRGVGTCRTRRRPPPYGIKASNSLVFLGWSGRYRHFPILPYMRSYKQLTGNPWTGWTSQTISAVVAPHVRLFRTHHLLRSSEVQFLSKS